jgi:hypothetical protein
LPKLLDMAEEFPEALLRSTPFIENSSKILIIPIPLLVSHNLDQAILEVLFSKANTAMESKQVRTQVVLRLYAVLYD